MRSFLLFGRSVLLISAVCLVSLSPALSQVKGPAGAPLRTITISAERGAIVWIDGVRFGKTNDAGRLEIRTVPAGAHTLRVRADGFKEKVQPLAATQKGEVKVVLVKTEDEAELAYQEGERLTGVDRQRSAAAYRRAIKARPNYPEAFLALARILLAADDLDGAAKAIAGARRLRPGYAEASAVEGRIFQDGGEEEKAVAAYKRAIAEGKGFQPEAYAGLGLLYKEKAETFGGSGDFQNEDLNYAESAKYLKVSLKQLSGAPDTVIMYQLLGLIYERQKKYADAIEIYEEFLRFFPDTTEATAVRSFIVQLEKHLTPQ